MCFSRKQVEKSWKGSEIISTFTGLGHRFSILNTHRISLIFNRKFSQGTFVFLKHSKVFPQGTTWSPQASWKRFCCAETISHCLKFFRNPYESRVFHIFRGFILCFDVKHHNLRIRSVPALFLGDFSWLCKSRDGWISYILFSQSLIARCYTHKTLINSLCFAIPCFFPHLVSFSFVRITDRSFL